MAETTPKSRRARRQFDEDFKAQAVRLVLDEGKTVPTVARDLDLTETALREWVHRARANRKHGRTGLTMMAVGGSASLTIRQGQLVALRSATSTDAAVYSKAVNYRLFPTWTDVRCP